MGRVIVSDSVPQYKGVAARYGADRVKLQAAKLLHGLQYSFWRGRETLGRQMLAQDSQTPNMGWRE